MAGTAFTAKNGAEAKSKKREASGNMPSVQAPLAGAALTISHCERGRPMVWAGGRALFRLSEAIFRLPKGVFREVNLKGNMKIASADRNMRPLRELRTRPVGLAMTGFMVGASNRHFILHPSDLHIAPPSR